MRGKWDVKCFAKPNTAVRKREIESDTKGNKTGNDRIGRDKIDGSNG